ncbi:MAG: iron chelate uptake ABC transporter family permease subunit [Candidatus Thermoplasmatota archaeon]|jgi:iron complex transport system permease protein|nr:iron chelate uptake ABC transporter family permease subunit [Candidatus Thermoplasmatota archaeon]MCL5441587.1 iron chelate uptake ABC transporter family permease subunit [Candidatus Thermoplasmatota archaeon]
MIKNIGALKVKSTAPGRIKGILWIFIIAAVLFITTIFSSLLGPVKISPLTVFNIFVSQIPIIGVVFHFSIPETSYVIVVYLREPEIIGAIIVGASLGTGGAVVQSVFRNPITEPYIIGISSGAALGAVSAIVFSLSLFGLFSVQIMAFIFALIVVLAVYLFSFHGSRTPPTYLLLTGISISLFISSIVGLLIYTNIKLENAAFFWLLGSLQGISWSELIPVSVVVIASVAVIWSMSGQLNAFQLGEAYAHSVGINVERTKALLMGIVALSVSAAVSISGLIGFVGLIIPHICRLLFGGSNRIVIPTSALLGALFLLLADDAARTAINGEVIPVGIVTGMIGIPFFLYLLRRMASGSYEN